MEENQTELLRTKLQTLDPETRAILLQAIQNTPQSDQSGEPFKRNPKGGQSHSVRNTNQYKPVAFKGNGRGKR